MSATPVGEFRLRKGQELIRQIRVDGDDLFAIDLDLRIDGASARGSVLMELIRPETGKVIARRRWTSEWLESHSKVYIPVGPYARDGNAFVLRIRALGVDVRIATTGTGNPVPLLYGKVRIPVIPAAELPDGRVYENLAMLPRYWAVWQVRQLSTEQLFSVPLDFAREAIVKRSPDERLTNLGKIVPWLRRAQIRILRYSAADQLIETRSEVPFLLATSEKLTPELRVKLDGRRATPIEINGLFTGVGVPVGTHRIELTRRIGRGLSLLSLAAVAMLFLVGILEHRSKLRSTAGTESTE